MKNLFNFCQIVLGIILLSACTKENILKYNEKHSFHLNTGKRYLIYLYN